MIIVSLGHLPRGLGAGGRSGKSHHFGSRLAWHTAATKSKVPPHTDTDGGRHLFDGELCERRVASVAHCVPRVRAGDCVDSRLQSHREALHFRRGIYVRAARERVCFCLFVRLRNCFVCQWWN